MKAMYQSRRPLLRQLGLAGGGSFLAVLLCLGRRVPLEQPTASRSPESTHNSTRFRERHFRRQSRSGFSFDGPSFEPGFFFTVRVLARSVQNRLSIAIPLAVAVAVATVSLRCRDSSASLDFSSAPIALLAVQLLFVAAWSLAFVIPFGCRQICAPGGSFISYGPPISPRIWRASNGPRSSSWCVPVLLALLPLHVLALGGQTAILHFTYGLLGALVLDEAFLLGYRQLPFASSYVPAVDVTTHGGVYASSSWLACTRWPGWSAWR